MSVEVAIAAIGVVNVAMANAKEIEAKISFMVSWYVGYLLFVV